MRLSFPNGEHPDVLLEDGELTIGSAAGNRVLIPGIGLSDRHAEFRLDGQRGLFMRLSNADASAHVNARPVKEFAFLRMGDVVSLERLQLILKPDHDAQIDPNVPTDLRPLTEEAQRAGASRVVVRGVSGSFSGRSVSLQDPVRIGRSENSDIRLDDPEVSEEHATLELHGEKVVLRAKSEASIVVNGVAVRDAVLHPGDQLAIDGHRFVIEAPGLPPRGSSQAQATPGAAAGSTQTLQAVRKEHTGSDGKPSARSTPRSVPSVPAEPEDEAEDGFSYGWLILAAAAIGAGLAALLVYAPR